MRKTKKKEINTEGSTEAEITNNESGSDSLAGRLIVAVTVMVSYLMICLSVCMLTV